MLDKRFLRIVPLPADLTNEEIFQAMKDTQDFFSTIHEKTGINLSTIIQANNFSGVVSNVFTKMLSDCSSYHFISSSSLMDLISASRTSGQKPAAS